MKILYRFLIEYLRELQVVDFLVKPLASIITLIAIAMVAWLAFYLTRKILVGIIFQVAKRTKTTWDDELVKSKFFSALAHFVPAAILLYSANFAMPDLKGPVSELSHELVTEFSKDYIFFLQELLEKIARLYLILVFVLAINRFLNASTEIYNATPISQNRPIKGSVQLVKILIYFLAGIFIIAILIKKDPTVLIAGLGAMAAVLLLIFKDTILGFVASIQLSANKMLAIGDWIEMPGHNASGTVIDISLNTVKVQNGDMTITTIPTYALVAESFNNWKGMEESDGRRIKRSISIDLNSIKFCTPEMLQRLQQFDLLREFIQQKTVGHVGQTETNNEKNLPVNQPANIGLFRKYLEEYLHRNEKFNQEMTCLVRHLQPGEKGLPIEIYVFSKEKRFVDFEKIQADLFEHIIAVLPEFDLKIFQLPSGNDVRK